jgi:hypothetical protein
VVTVNEALDGHVVLDIQCLDRLYLSGFVQGLQTPGGVVFFLHQARGMPISTGKRHLGDLRYRHELRRSSTICARRQVTTDPVPRRTIRNRRAPSSSSISRTCTLSATPNSLS